MMKEIGNLKFHRSIIPVGAADFNNHAIDIADASNKIACAAIYAWFWEEITHINSVNFSKI